MPGRPLRHAGLTVAVSIATDESLYRAQKSPTDVGHQAAVGRIGKGRPSLIQANVFGAADIALPVEGGTQNPRLGAARLWNL